MQGRFGDQVQIDCGNIGDKDEKVSGRGNRANFE